LPTDPNNLSIEYFKENKYYSKYLMSDLTTEIELGNSAHVTTLTIQPAAIRKRHNSFS
jgi:hypothetical protein